MYCSKENQHELLFKNIRKCLTQKQFKQYKANIDTIELTTEDMKSYYNMSINFQMIFIGASEKKKMSLKKH